MTSCKAGLSAEVLLRPHACFRRNVAVRFNSNAAPSDAGVALIAIAGRNSTRIGNAFDVMHRFGSGGYWKFLTALCAACDTFHPCRIAPSSTLLLLRRAAS